mmetsp:Transcript_12583/g.23237  ORF Transcript_12583/g.23237 Transcript_12583/m.23237 type:complete len:467 (+) Transcript_12583:42-1442(+)
MGMGCSQGTVTATAQCKPGELNKKGFYDDYVLGKKLGSGAFAQVRVVFAAGCPQDDHQATLAVKIIDMRKDKTDGGKAPKDGADNIDSRVKMDTKCEAAVWRRVTQEKVPNVVQLHEIYWDASCCYMVMEKCDMTLLNELEHAPELSEPYLASLFHEMARACAGLHRIKVIHRDIKPDNFLVNRPGRLKLGDFGLSSIYTDGQPLTEVYGTAPFMAPEMLRDGRYDERADVWSVGVVFYVLLFGQFPYFAQEKSSKAMKMAIKEGKIAPSFRPWKAAADAARPSQELEDLTRRMIARNPSDRSTAEEVLNDPFWAKSRAPGFYSKPSSFRPMLQGAVRAGAFTVPRRNKEQQRDSTDALLSELSRKSRSRSDSITSSRMSPMFQAQMGRVASSASSTNQPNSPGLVPKPRRGSSSDLRKVQDECSGGDMISRVSTAVSGGSRAEKSSDTRSMTSGTGERSRQTLGL